MIQVVSRKFYNQLHNGEDFSLNAGDYTNYLLGNAGGKYKAVIELGVSWYSIAESVDTGTSIVDINPFIFRSSDDTITRKYGSWVNDGFKIGDSIQVVSTSAINDGTYTVTNVSDLILTCSGASFTNQTDSDAIIVGITTLTDFEYKYGLIENDESVNYYSKIDDNTQAFVLSGVSGTPTTMNAKGLQKTWQNGSCKVSTGSGTPLELASRALTFSGTTQTFIIEHEFILLPYYLDGDESNIQTSTPIDLFETDKCLKYVFACDISTDFNNPNSKHSGSDSLMLGNTGWIDENYNANQKTFSVSNISYVDKLTGSSVEGVQLNRSTTVTAVITGDLIDSSTNFALTHSLLPIESAYKGSLVQNNTFEENFLYENFVATFGDSSASGDIIENVVPVVDSSTQGTITFDINYSTANQALLDYDSYYFLGLLIERQDLTSEDQTMLKLDCQLYNKGEYGDDTSGLISFNNLNLYQHTSDTGISGNTQIEVYVEDKIMCSFTFTMAYNNLSTQPAIQSITPQLVAYNPVTEESFVIQKEVIDTSIFPIAYNATLGGNVQTISIDKTRGFKLVNGSDFNLVQVTRTGGSTISVEHRLNFAFAFNWEDYKSNPDVNSIFFDSNELNNGLNYDSSHFSENIGASDWGVYLFFDFDVENTVDGSITTYRQISPEIPVFDYNTYTDVTNPYTVSKKFTNQSGVDTSLTILNNENTKVWFEFVDSRGDVGPVYEGIIRIQEYQNGSLKTIDELSTTENSASNNILIPLTGDTKARITKSPSNTLTLECQIDKDRIEVGKQYQVTGRIFTEFDELVIYEDGIGILFEDGNSLEFE